VKEYLAQRLAAVSLLVYKQQDQALGFGRLVKGCLLCGLGGKRSHAVRLIALFI
jgi:hypothetical protein